MLLIYDRAKYSWGPCILFPGVVDLLQQLRRAGYLLGIITNGSVRTQQPKIERGGLAPLVDVALISEAEGVRKPDAEIFARATQRLGVATQECVMVGDNPLADVGGALAVGMQAIWRRGYLPWPADAMVSPPHTVDTIGELHDIDWQNL